MSEILSSMDLLNGIKGKAVTDKSAMAPRINCAKALESIQDSKMRNAMYDMITKEVGSGDVAQLRLVSLAPRVGELRNAQTIFLNMLEANPVVPVQDFQVRIREHEIGTDTSKDFNPGGSLPAEATSVRPFRQNTVGFTGNKLKIRFIAQELGKQSPVSGTDVRAQEVDMEITRIRRRMNSVLLTGVEQTSEAAGDIPTPGGLYTRSTSYQNNLAVAADLTEALIQSRLDAVAALTSANGYGYRPMVCMLGGPTQLSKVRNLMITRFPGENSMSHLQSTAAYAGRLANANVPLEQMQPYMPEPGMPVLFVYEPMLTAGVALFFDPVQTQLAKFNMFGSQGPWVLERPTEDLLYLLVAFDAYSLLDPIVASRASISNLNS